MKNKIKLMAGSGISGIILAVPALVRAAGANIESFTLSNYTDTNLPGGTVMEIITGILNWLLIAIGVLGVIGFIIAGILYLTAAGNDKQIEKAKGAMVACIIGVIVGLAGYVALQFAVGLLGGGGDF